MLNNYAKIDSEREGLIDFYDFIGKIQESKIKKSQFHLEIGFLIVLRISF